MKLNLNNLFGIDIFRLIVFRFSLLFLVNICFINIYPSEITLPEIINDSMIIQRNKPVKIWGKAVAGAQIMVDFNNQQKSATVDANGNFSVFLDAMTASLEPKNMIISCGNDSKEFKGVLIGDVFLCSGQSNMQFQIASLTDEKVEALADSDYPNIRYYEVAKNYTSAFVGNEDIPDIPWRKINSSMVTNMTAVGFYFSRNLYKNDPQVPIGIIGCNQGSSFADAWISLEYYNAHPSLIPYRRNIIDISKNSAGAYSNPGVLYANMLNRVLPYTLKGFLWYQGESNSSTYYNYKKIFPAVIDCFRESWNDSELPFFFVQLSAYEPPGVFWPLQREVQDSVAQVTPHTAMISSIDAGDANDIHPKRKKIVGDRLAYAVRKLIYGENNVMYSGPRFQSFRAEQNKAIITFDNAIGLHTKGTLTDELEICDSNYIYLPATNAEIQNDELIVWHTNISNPVAVRYAWANVPTPNLYNNQQLPANPFRTSKEAPRNIYVSYLRGNDTGVGSLEDPLKTISKASSLLEDFKKSTIRLEAGDVFTEDSIVILKNKVVEIVGENSTIQAASVKRVATHKIMYISANADVIISGVNFKNGYITEGESGKSKSGGAICNEGNTLVLNRCKFIDNVAAMNGGAIANYGKSMIINQSYFEGNVSEGGFGGAIAQLGIDGATDNELNIYSSTFAKDSTIFQNSMTGTGAAIHIQSTSAGSNVNIEIINCTFLENYAKTDNQAALNFGGYQSSTSYVINNTFYKNTPSAIYTLNANKHRICLVNNVIAGGPNGIWSNTKTTGGSPRAAIEAYNNIIYASNLAVNGNVNETCLNSEKMAYNNILGTLSDAGSGKVALASSLVTENVVVPYLPISSSSSELIDKGLNEKILEGINRVPTRDICGKLTSGVSKDIGSYEWEGISNGLLQASQNISFRIYPNPAHDYLSIQTNEKIERIRAFDLLGNMIIEQPYENRIDIRKLPTGIYLLQLLGTDHRIISIRFYKSIMN